MSKLVRDLIPSIIPENKRSHYRFTVLDDADYNKFLNQKLVEEVQEYLEAENIEEMADILEVLDAIMKFKKFDRSQVEAVKAEKLEKRGGFEKKILMESIQ